MPELDQFTAETFAPYLHNSFRIEYADGESLLVELAEVSVMDKRLHHHGRLPFSLIFRGGRDRYLPQRLYRVAHDTLGTLDIFLVPLGPDTEGLMRYEAVFN